MNESNKADTSASARPLRLALANLGCKLNHAEGEAMKHLCAGAGYELVPFSGEADVYVVNSCTVTAEADREGRRLARRARRMGGADARVVIAGCSAQANAEKMLIPEADLLLGNREKLHLHEELAKPFLRDEKPEMRISPIEESLDIESVVLPQFGSRTRAYLKVQDGCNFSCSFCATTIARGASRSLEVDSCVEHADTLLSGGHEELVLTGIHLGAYGRDIKPRSTLSRLVSRLLGMERTFRLRLSSVEPGEFTRELIRVVAGEAYGSGRSNGGSYVCRHFHIPVQSGDDETLGAMKRNYTAARCASRFDEIAKKIDGACLGGDFIVGFPGESKEAFERTMEWGAGIAAGLSARFFRIHRARERRPSRCRERSQRASRKPARARCRSWGAGNGRRSSPRKRGGKRRCCSRAAARKTACSPACRTITSACRPPAPMSG